MAPDVVPLILHASCVAWQGRAVLITGASGRGKSALALQLIALGARLVADDRTCLTPGPQGPVAAPPASIAGLIEARHVGLLRLPHIAPVPITLAVDMDHTEAERLPKRRSISYLGGAVALLHRVDGPHFPAAVLQCLSGARTEP